MSKKIVVAIPARFNSSRFPGKPLAEIGDKSMLERVFLIAQEGIKHNLHAEVIITTEDERIKTHAEKFCDNVLMTSDDCKTGSDRVLSACSQLSYIPDIVVNLQGDAPFTPPDFISSIINTLLNNLEIDVATPVVKLPWTSLDILRERKKTTPFSGTTAIVDSKKSALWFSKQIIPAIRNEQTLRNQLPLSPVYQHIGLYGYQFKALQKFVHLSEGEYEKLEGLEQLRMLENGLKIQAVEVSHVQFLNISGIDTPEDLRHAEKIILDIKNSHHA